MTRSTGDFSGTIVYTAPEVLGEEKPSEASDVYSLGAMLFALLTGRPAFAGTSDSSPLALLNRVLRDPVPDLRPDGFPDGLCAAIEAAMAKDPTARPPSAAALGEMLQDVQRELAWPVDRLIVGQGDVWKATVPPAATVPPEPPAPEPPAPAAPAVVVPAAPDTPVPPRRPWAALGVLAVAVALAVLIGALAGNAARRHNDGPKPAVVTTSTTPIVSTSIPIDPTGFTLPAGARATRCSRPASTPPTRGLNMRDAPNGNAFGYMINGTAGIRDLGEEATVSGIPWRRVRALVFVDNKGSLAERDGWVAAKYLAKADAAHTQAAAVALARGIDRTLSNPSAFRGSGLCALVRVKQAKHGRVVLRRRRVRRG